MKRILLLALVMLVGVSLTPFAQEETLVCDKGFRHIVHAVGETCVPENPQRVVAMDMATLELLLILDNPPVAGSKLAFDAFASMLPELSDELDAILENGYDTGYPPNIEVVLEAAPDLIIGPRDFFTEILYPEMNKVTPTVLYDPIPGDWRSRLIFAGEVLGKSELVTQLIADYDARVAEFRDVMPETETPIQVSLVRTLANQQIGLPLDGTVAASVLKEAGLARPAEQGYDYEYVLSSLGGRPELMISVEQLGLADGDIIFLFGTPDHLLENPLWNALSAVKDGRSFVVGYHWWGDSLMTAHAMLDDLFTYVAETTPTLPNPFAQGEITPEVTPESTPETTE